MQNERSDIFGRVRLLVGDEAYDRITQANVILFGVGGVGAWCAESLVRSGVSHLTIVDSDCVDVTNINRQLPATLATIGRPKVEVMKERLLSINPDAEITAIRAFYDDETADSYDFDKYDYVVDAIDSLSSKALLILRASSSKARLVSSMGAALKSDPTRVRVAEFWDVKGCPLARALRQRFKRQGLKPRRKFQCVYSDELLNNRGFTEETCSYKAQINGTLAHITAIFGFTLAGLIVNRIVGKMS